MLFKATITTLPAFLRQLERTVADLYNRYCAQEFLCLEDCLTIDTLIDVGPIIANSGSPDCIKTIVNGLHLLKFYKERIPLCPRCQALGGYDLPDLLKTLRAKRPSHAHAVH